jgi:hypothetical protein
LAARSESLAKVTPAVRWTFAMLWTYCDDYGRGVDNVRLVKADIYPLDDDMTSDVIDDHLHQLVEIGCIVRYQVGGKRYLAVPEWWHQKVDHPKDSDVPPPQDAGAREAFAKSRESVPSGAPSNTRGQSVASDDAASSSKQADSTDELSTLSTRSPDAREKDYSDDLAKPRETVAKPHGKFAPVLGNREQGTGNRETPCADDSAREGNKPERQRAPDPVWDSLLAACGISSDEKITNSARGAYNHAVADLRNAGAQPDEIARRAREHRRRWPGKLTPTALVRRWAELARAPTPEDIPAYQRRRLDAPAAKGA